jgi:hypothetical protein
LEEAVAGVVQRVAAEPVGRLVEQSRYLLGAADLGPMGTLWLWWLGKKVVMTESNKMEDYRTEAVVGTEAHSME